MKKLILTGALALLSLGAFAQNVQLHYDFGHNMYKGKDGKDLQSRGYLTTTVEMFKPDSWGSTYFFVDMDYMSNSKAEGATKTAGVLGAYWEISRELCFWQNTKMDWLSLHVEYNGGLTNKMSFNNAWLAGLTYSGHSKNFSKTWSISAMYKLIPGTVDGAGKKQVHNFQLTGVWGINFAHGWCTFSGFVDFWREHRPWQGKLNEAGVPTGTQFIALSEPQFWVNLNQIKGMEKVNLSLGGEVELSYNFANTGFYCIPTLAAKWSF